VGILQAEATGLSYRKISQIFGRSERLEDFAIVMRRLNAFIGKKALEGSAKLPNERIAP
jgi:hypothetical protein